MDPLRPGVLPSFPFYQVLNLPWPVPSATDRAPLEDPTDLVLVVRIVDGAGVVGRWPLIWIMSLWGRLQMLY